MPSRWATAAASGRRRALHAFKKGELPEDFILVGDFSLLELCNRRLGYEVPLRRAADARDVRPGFVNVLDLNLLSADGLSVGQISRASGQAALRYVERATHLALAGEVAAVVTLPINKEATRLARAGIHRPHRVHRRALRP